MNYFRCLSIAGVLGTTAFSAAQPVARTVWNVWTSGPAGSTQHLLSDIATWPGPGNQNGIHTGGYMRYEDIRTTAPIFQHSKAGVQEFDSYLASNFNTQWVYCQKVASHPNATGVYFGGYIRYSSQGNRNATIGKRGQNLSTGWLREFDVNSGGSETITHLVVDRRGGVENIYAAGSSSKDGLTRWFLAKYTGSGAFQWLKVGEDASQPSGLAVDNEGFVYFAYLIPGENGHVRNRIVKYDSMGTYKWRNGYNPASHLSTPIYDLAIADGGPVIVGGAKISHQMAINKPFAAGFSGDGVRRFGFIRSFDGTYTKAVAMRASSSFYAVGKDPGQSILSAQINPANGASTWMRVADPGAVSPTEETFAGIDQWDNLYFASGADLNALVGVYIGKYSPAGAIQWTLFDSNAGGNMDANGMIVHPTTGMVALAGAYRVNGVPSFMMVGYAQKAQAVNDPNMTMASNTTFTSNVWSNDRYSDGGTFTVVTPPASGSLTLEPNGEFSYTPPVGFTGTRTFTYKISRAGVADSNVATATILVQ